MLNECYNMLQRDKKIKKFEILLQSTFLLQTTACSAIGPQKTLVFKFCVF
jgi:hypothetical protein